MTVRQRVLAGLGWLTNRGGRTGWLLDCANASSPRSLLTIRRWQCAGFTAAVYEQPFLVILA
jgi:hypothetical protein